jgi:hypothetical protein
VHLTESFKYLGYHIKADSLKSSDWNWLIAKVEKRIGPWCNCWFTLGGRYTLLKGVLEGQPVYWMALASISNSVLDKLRKLSFSFLWYAQHMLANICAVGKLLLNQKRKEAGGSKIPYTPPKLWRPIPFAVH